MKQLPNSPHPGLTPFFRNDIIGAGLKSAAGISEDTFIIDYTGKVSKKQITGPFVLEVEANNLWIDGSCGGNASKLINHSCDPNCIMHIEPETRRAMIFARRTIAPGEELTLSYQGNLPFECICGICSEKRESHNKAPAQMKPNPGTTLSIVCYDLTESVSCINKNK